MSVVVLVVMHGIPPTQRYNVGHLTVGYFLCYYDNANKATNDHIVGIMYCGNLHKRMHDMCIEKNFYSSNKSREYFYR